MLTPIDIQRKVFKSGIGYEKKDVDGFLKELMKDYESIYKENVELNDKINVLNEGIQYYKSIEKTLQKALVLAQRTSDETKEAAKKEAAAIRKEAKARADEILVDAKRDLEVLCTKTVNLIQQYELYKTQFRQLVAAQMEILSSENFTLHLSDLDAFQVSSQSQSYQPSEEPYKEKDDTSDGEVQE